MSEFSHHTASARRQADDLQWDGTPSPPFRRELGSAGRCLSSQSNSSTTLSGPPGHIPVGFGLREPDDVAVPHAGGSALSAPFEEPHKLDNDSTACFPEPNIFTERFNYPSSISSIDHAGPAPAYTHTGAEYEAPLLFPSPTDGDNTALIAFTPSPPREMEPCDLGKQTPITGPWSEPGVSSAMYASLFGSSPLQSDTIAFSWDCQPWNHLNQGGPSWSKFNPTDPSSIALPTTSADVAVWPSMVSQAGVSPLYYTSHELEALKVEQHLSMSSSISTSPATLDGNTPEGLDQAFIDLARARALSGTSGSGSRSHQDPKKAPKPATLGNRVQKIKPKPISTGGQLRKRTFGPGNRSCIRCQMQKESCQRPLDDPDGPCTACRNMSTKTRKTVHRGPCFRAKVQDIVLHRDGCLNLTRRWYGTEMHNVQGRGGRGTERVIAFTLELFEEPIRLVVVPFEPMQGDVTARYWTVKYNGQDVRRSKELAPYCLQDIEETADYFVDYIQRNAIPAFAKIRVPSLCGGNAHRSEDIIERTYRLALQHYRDLNDMEIPYKDAHPRPNPHKLLLGNLFKLWFAIRHTTGSSYICSEETLDMLPELDDPTYPLYGKVSIPRMVLAQFDSLVTTRLLHDLTRQVLRQLEALLTQKDRQRSWITVYLCMFIFLREASWLTQDRYRHARAVYGNALRYSIPKFVEELQEGCNVLLAFWHYYSVHPLLDPRTAGPNRPARKVILDPGAYELIMDTRMDPFILEQLHVWRVYKEQNGFLPIRINKDMDPAGTYTGPQSQYDWDNNYYWIAQLHEPDWRPHPTYQRQAV